MSLAGGDGRVAGGDGTRLREPTQAITGAPIPKQYCRILGDRSLLETTLERIAGSGAFPPASVLAQPCNRDTGPGVLFGLLEIARRSPAARVALFPSDHYVSDDGSLPR